MRKQTRSAIIRENLWLVLALALFTSFVAAQQPVRVQVDAGKSQGPLKPVWTYFGADEPNYSYATNGRQLVGELSALSAGTVQIRVHNLLTTGDGTGSLKWGSTNAYTEDASGKPVVRLENH